MSNDIQKYVVNCTIHIAAESLEEAATEAYLAIFRELDYIVFDVGLEDGECYSIHMKDLITNEPRSRSIIQERH